MGWLVLKNRRHDGPYSLEALDLACRAGRLHLQDFVIDEADLGMGNINYRKIVEVVPARAAPPPPSAQGGFSDERSDMGTRTAMAKLREIAPSAAETFERALAPSDLVGALAPGFQERTNITRVTQVSPAMGADMPEDFLESGVAPKRPTLILALIGCVVLGAVGYIAMKATDSGPKPASVPAAAVRTESSSVGKELKARNRNRNLNVRMPPSPQRSEPSQVADNPPPEPAPAPPMSHDNQPPEMAANGADPYATGYSPPVQGEPYGANVPYPAAYDAYGNPLPPGYVPTPGYDASQGQTVPVE